MGGYAGAAMAKVGMTLGWSHATEATIPERPRSGGGSIR